MPDCLFCTKDDCDGRHEEIEGIEACACAYGCTCDELIHRDQITLANCECCDEPVETCPNTRQDVPFGFHPSTPWGTWPEPTA